MADITGKIIAALPPRTGTSSRGDWQCNTYVLETQDRYPKRVAFDVFGIESINKLAIQVGETLTVSIEINANEHNGRWFNHITAWNVIRASQPQTAAMTPPANAPYVSQPQQGTVFAAPPQPQQVSDAVSNGLPF